MSKDKLGFTHGFVASLSVIVVSELGDKTFFIAAIMAMTHSRVTVLMGALGALFFMTFLSGGLCCIKKNKVCKWTCHMHVYCCFFLCNLEKAAYLPSVKKIIFSCSSDGWIRYNCDPKGFNILCIVCSVCCIRPENVKRGYSFFLICCVLLNLKMCSIHSSCTFHYFKKICLK